MCGRPCRRANNRINSGTASGHNGEAVSLVQEGEDLAARLQKELEGVGGHVARVRHAAEAAQYVTRLAEEKGAEVVVRWQSDLLDTLEIDDALQTAGAEVHTAAPPSGAEAADRRQELRDLLARADMGLSGVDAVIAETGTLMLKAQPGQMRGVSLLPPLHVAVARTDQVVATFADALRTVRQSGVDLQEQPHELHLLRYRPQPHRRHRAQAHRRGARAGRDAPHPVGRPQHLIAARRPRQIFLRYGLKPELQGRGSWEHVRGRTT